jgi:AhpD family alkylhydroperoxidase
MRTESVEPRIDYRKIAPEAVQALWALERYARTSEIERPLLELVKLRASMINGCGYCVDMHSKDARALGESEQRLYAPQRLARGSVFHVPRARRPGMDRGRDQSRLRPCSGRSISTRPRAFDERQLVDLTMAIIAINAWNRLAIAFRAVAGTYEPAKQHSAE